MLLWRLELPVRAELGVAGGQHDDADDDDDDRDHDERNGAFGFEYQDGSSAFEAGSYQYA